MTDHYRPQRRDRRRAAFTLVELTIALGIFVLVMALTMDSLTSMTTYSTQESSLTDTVLSARAAVRLITNDIANSSWLYDYDQINNLEITAGPPFPNPGTGYSPLTLHAPYQNNPLLPWVWIDGVQSDGTINPAVSNSAVTTTTTTAGITTTVTTPYGNPLWEKDTFEYLKVRTSADVTYSPTDERYQVINQATVPVTTLDQFQTAPGSPFLILNSNYVSGASGNNIFVSHVWEAGLTGPNKSAPNPFTPLNFNQNQDPAFLRHYHLEVINSTIMPDNPTIQTGTLVRTYWNGDGTTLPAFGNDTTNALTVPSWNPDDQLVLMDNVQAFVVRTYYQTLPNPTLLQPNQISVLIVVKKRTASPGVYTTQTFSFITSMRSLAQ
jgi:type II secretory pathway pseudopilin PulG